MVKKIPRQEESQPFDYFANERKSQKLNITSSENVINKLRPDMLPSTEALPTKGNILLRIDIKVVLGLFLASVIVGLIAFSLYGAGRQNFEKSLFGLYNIQATPSQFPSETIIPITKPLSVTRTPTSWPTSKPINTAPIPVISSPTLLPPSATSVILVIPSSTPIASSPDACRDVETITIADVGQTLCVQGSVEEVVQESNNFMVIFSNKSGAFYWVTYDMVWTSGEVGQCYQVRGKIDQIASSPVLVFNYNNIPVECPK